MLMEAVAMNQQPPNQYEITYALIKAGADVKFQQDETGRTALINACYAEDSSRVIKLLIRSGADVNAYGPQCIPPISYAKSSKRSDIVKALRAAGSKDYPENMVYVQY